MAEYIERDAVLSLTKDICVLTKWDSEYHHRSIDPCDIPEHETLGGYLKSIPFKDACVLMWGNLTAEEKELVKQIPNFDACIFYKITGIEVDT